MNISIELSIYVVLAGRDKDKGKDIDDLFYILSQLIKW